MTWGWLQHKEINVIFAELSLIKNVFIIKWLWPPYNFQLTGCQWRQTAEKKMNMQFQRSYCAWGCRAMPLGFWMSSSIKISLSMPFKPLREIEDNLKHRMVMSVEHKGMHLRKCVCIFLYLTLYQSSTACDGPSPQPDPRVSRVQRKTASLWNLHPVKPSQYASGFYLQNTPKQTNKTEWLLLYDFIISRKNKTFK